MKQKIYAALVAAVLSIPVVASAQQSNADLTRARVRAELVQLEKAGDNPTRRNDPHYPADIQVATARLQATNSVTQNATTSDYGGIADGSSQAGTSTMARLVERPVYSGH